MSVLGVAREIAALTGGTSQARSCRCASTAAAQPVASGAVQAPQRRRACCCAACTGLNNRGTTSAVDAGAPASRRTAQHQPGGRRHELRAARNRASPCMPTMRGACRAHCAVRMARAGEKLQLLDERTIELTPDVLLIADDSGPIGLAGIMGGQGTSITADVTDVLLEVAYFAPRGHRRSRASPRLADRCQPALRARRGSAGAGRGNGARHGDAAAALRRRGRRRCRKLSTRQSLPCAHAGAAAARAPGAADRRPYCRRGVERSLARPGHAACSRMRMAGR